jgi:hypothetical protein
MRMRMREMGREAGRWALMPNKGYGMDRYPKLRVLKKKYDPTNLFKNNMNIDPAE